jgi:hypothetical protein
LDIFSRLPKSHDFGYIEAGPGGRPKPGGFGYVGSSCDGVERFARVEQRGSFAVVEGIDNRPAIQPCGHEFRVGKPA